MPEKPNPGSAPWMPMVTADPPDGYITSGMFFGKSSGPGKRDSGGAPICSTPGSHTLVVAPTYSGKGTRVIIPTLLRYQAGSLIVIDRKGATAAVTARARAKLPGSAAVHIINPWDVLRDHFETHDLPFATYNPLDVLEKDDPNVVAVAQSLAKAMCPQETGDFWSASAADLITAVLLYLTDYHSTEQKTLARARELLTQPKRQFDNTLAHLLVSEAYGGAIREFAGSFRAAAAAAPQTYAGIIAAVSQHMGFISDPRLKEATATSSFSMDDLLTESTSIYLIVPTEQMENQGPWLRLMIAAALHTYRRAYRGGDRRCLFVIDEFPALGRIDEITGPGIAMTAGYGVDFALVTQSLDQIKGTYGESAESILNNCAFKWFCGLSTFGDLKYLSEALCENAGRQPTPEEIRNLGRDVAILLAPGPLPHYLRPIDYWELASEFPHKEFKEPPLVWDPNPYITGSR